MKKTISHHAAEVLLETDNPAVAWGDSGLLDTIADRAGIKAKHPLVRWQRVLNALERSPLFDKRVIRIPRRGTGNQTNRLFTLRIEDLWSCYTCDYVGLPGHTTDDASEEDEECCCPECGTIDGDGFGMVQNDPRFRLEDEAEAPQPQR